MGWGQNFDEGVVDARHQIVEFGNIECVVGAVDIILSEDRELFSPPGWREGFLTTCLEDIEKNG